MLKRIALSSWMTVGMAGLFIPAAGGGALAAEGTAASKPAVAKAGPTTGDAKPAPATKTDAPVAKSDGAPAKAGDTAAKSDGAAAKAGDTVAKSDGAEAKDDVPRRAKPPWHKKPTPHIANVGEGASPASPSPLTVSGLRDEIHREAASGTIDPAAPARTKVEQMLAEIAKTRQALHEDTARLEGMMADAPESATPGAPGPGGAANASGKPAAKNPLDVLAKALRGIKPEQAAPIVARLDLRLAATVLLRMPPVDAGKIMGALKPDNAAQLATQIAMRVPGGEAKR